MALSTEERVAKIKDAQAAEITFDVLGYKALDGADA